MPSKLYKNVYIKDYYSIAGVNENNGSIKYNMVINDYYFEEETFFASEVKMQQTVIDKLMKRNKLDKVDLMVGGDLSNQNAITYKALSKYNNSVIGVYGACSTFVEAMIVSSLFIENREINNSIVVTSSHNLNAERQFRYPIEYGVPLKKTCSNTATGAVALYLTHEKTNLKVEASTIGKIVDYDIKDANNLGAVMAPSAVDTLLRHLKDLKRDVSYYDLILTGDLGSVGAKLFKEMLKNNNIDIKNHIDAGEILYLERQEFNAGASGPVVLPLVMFNKIIKSKKYKKILLIATGSLHSKDTVNQSLSIPSIAHAISLEVLE